MEIVDYALELSKGYRIAKSEVTCGAGCLTKLFTGCRYRSSNEPKRKIRLSKKLLEEKEEFLNLPISKTFREDSRLPSAQGQLPHRPPTLCSVSVILKARVSQCTCFGDTRPCLSVSQHFSLLSQFSPKAGFRFIYQTLQ